MKILQQSQDATANAEYQAACNHVLQELLGQFNNRDSERIRERLDEIMAALEEDLDMEEGLDLRFGGSVAKHTFVDGLSDVDSLILLNRSELAEMAPADVRQYFADRLRARLTGVEVREGNLSVTVSFGDVEVQLLPAVKVGDRYRISDESGRDWAEIRPRDFARRLTVVNERTGSKVVPVIKLAKGIIGGLPERQRLGSYHVEALAVEIFDGYRGQRSHTDMLQHFFSEASDRVLRPMRDQTGQSPHLDSYLGSPGSLERHLVSDTCNRIARRIKAIVAAGLTDQLRELFGDLS